MRGINKEYRPLVDFARENGWTVEITNGNHSLWTSPTGERVYGSMTPGDYRSVKHLTRDLRNAGLDVPRRGYTPPKERDAIETEQVEVPRLVRTMLGRNEYAGASQVNAGVTDTALVDAAWNSLTENEAFDSEVTYRAALVQCMNDTCLVYETDEDPHSLAETVGVDPKGSVMALIGNTARFSGVNVTQVLQISQRVYDQVRSEAVRQGRKDGSRWLYQGQLKGIMVRLFSEAGVSDAAQVEGMVELVYKVLKNTVGSDPAMINVRRFTPAKDGTAAVPSIWSVADSWTAPTAIVPAFLTTKHTPDSIDKRAARLTPAEAGENRDPMPVTYKCADCDESFDNTMTYANHRRWKHNKTGNPVAPVKCPECSQICKGPAALSSHRRAHGYKAARVTLDGKRVSRKVAAERVLAEKLIEQKLQPKETPDTPPLDVDIDAAVEAAVRRIFGGLLGGGDDTDLAEALAEAEQAALKAMDEASTWEKRAVEAEAAVTLLVTEYINPNALRGVLDERFLP